LSPLPGSNQRPTDYKSVALPAELRRHFYLLYHPDSYRDKEAFFSYFLRPLSQIVVQI